jgi:DEAD/DEAH box helicase domain-containing protein
VSDATISRFAAAGVVAPWAHQVIGAEALHDGHHVVLATGTASGKTLAYLMPILELAHRPMPTQPTLEGIDASGRASAVLSALAEVKIARRPGALYLAPTKALAHDQFRVCRDLGPSDWRVTTLDGDSTDEERRFAREYATYVLTNPDMLHRSVLPQHQRWRSLLASLRVVVIDESHRYRGVFGAHVSAVVRRLRRLCHLYGADPVFCCVSATAANPVLAASRLTGVDASDFVLVDADASSHPARTLVVLEPSDDVDGTAAALLSDLVESGRQTLAFVSSRRGAESVSVRASARVATGGVAAYRGGYLPHDRRAIEQSLQTRALMGVAATNALELGVDISGMDAVVIAGLPGTTAALWQQAGRAGRGSAEAIVTIVPRLAPLDVHLTETPERLLGSPVEEVVLHADNPTILGPHLVAAAQESPLTDADTAWFGSDMAAILSPQIDAGLVRRRASAWFCASDDRIVDQIDLRSAGGPPYDIVEGTTGRILGTCDAGSVDALLHPGAVHLHQGEPWLVDRLDADERRVWVHAERTGYVTQPRVENSVHIIGVEATTTLGHSLKVQHGPVEVQSRVHAYLKRDDRTGRVLAQVPLAPVERRLVTHAVWLTFSASHDPGLLDAAVHGAEHALGAMLGGVAPNDRWDVAARSWLVHPQTGMATVMVWDRQAGGFARAGYGRAADWIETTACRLTSCGCATGCPRCCLSSDCDSPERPIDPGAAALLLRPDASRDLSGSASVVTLVS